MADLTANIHDEFMLGGTYTAWSPLVTFGILYGVFAFYMILTWYFDHIIGENRGVADGWFFFLRPSFWCRRLKRIRRRSSRIER